MQKIGSQRRSEEEEAAELLAGIIFDQILEESNNKNKDKEHENRILQNK